MITEGREELPDILGLCEVENDNAVGMLASKLGYTSFVVTASPDRRGIDVALLHRPSMNLQMLSWREHVMVGERFEKKPTRNVLEAEFQVGKSGRLIVFVNHWPSQAAPGSVRTTVARQVQAIIDERMAANPQTNIIMMGDFNVIATDNPHPFNTVTESPTAPNRLKDVYYLFKGVNRDIRNALPPQPRGSYFYPPKMTWNRLDRFFLTRNLYDGTGLEVIPVSYKIYAPKFAVRDFKYEKEWDYNFGSVITGVPWRYDITATTPEQAGFSDHFPIVLKLKAQ